jgi:hypothetical protein
VIKNLSISYAPSLPLVLKDVSLEVKQRQHVGGEWRRERYFVCNDVLLMIMILRVFLLFLRHSLWKNWKWKEYSDAGNISNA